MADHIASLKGVTPDLAGKLEKEGIKNADQLLAAATDYHKRGQLAKKVGVETSVLTEVVNRADLARIKGVAGVYADLLENAGVDSIKELAHRVPDHLHTQLDDINKKEHLTTHPPTLHQVEEWVSEAKTIGSHA
jgi:predicted flap endonuclease-1-like 5' DNA nuclease